MDITSAVDGDLRTSVVGRAFTDGVFTLLAEGPATNPGSLEIPKGAKLVGDVVFVQWSWKGRHTEDFVFAGTKATHRSVEIHGVTVVYDTDLGPYFGRFVDWSNVLAQVGVLPGRQRIGERPTTWDTDRAQFEEHALERLQEPTSAPVSSSLPDAPSASALIDETPATADPERSKNGEARVVVRHGDSSASDVKRVRDAVKAWEEEKRQADRTRQP